MLFEGFAQMEGAGVSEIEGQFAYSFGCILQIVGRIFQPNLLDVAGRRLPGTAQKACLERALMDTQMFCQGGNGYIPQMEPDIGVCLLHAIQE